MPTISFGFECPGCGESDGVTIGPVGRPTCPQCGRVMVPMRNAPPIMVNAYCPRCKKPPDGVVIGADRCDECGGPLGPMPSS
jgi:hypothetical protein